MDKKCSKKGFTLIEIMVSLFLSVLVAFFVYTMMISSYTAYRRLSSISKNANSIRYFITNFSNSIKYSETIPVKGTVNGQTSITFTVYDKNLNTYIKEKYYFVDTAVGGGFVENAGYSVSDATTVPYCSTLGLLKKDICRLDDSVIESIVISNVIRTIYFDWPAAPANYRLRQMNLSVIYDDIIDGKIDKSSGKVSEKADGSTEMLNNDTITRRLFNFCFRGFDAH